MEDTKDMSEKADLILQMGSRDYRLAIEVHNKCKSKGLHNFGKKSFVFNNTYFFV